MFCYNKDDVLELTVKCKDIKINISGNNRSTKHDPRS